MKNKLTDLNDHLFAQLERLSEENLEGEKLVAEVTRTKAITSVAKSVIENGRLVLEAQKELGSNVINEPPKLLGVK